MSHIRKLILTGEIPGRGKKVSSYHSWPAGEKQGEVEKIIHTFRRNHDNVTVIIQHHYID
jgi:hypothetical protein